MAFKDLISRNWGRRGVPVRHVDFDPFYTMQREMNRIFDEFSRAFNVTPFGSREEIEGTYTPNVDVIERDKEFQVLAELPSIEKNDVEVSVTNDILTIKGEKNKEGRKGKGLLQYRIFLGRLSKSYSYS